ncbi:hypothetical protein V6N13_123728 [Hibiscus sabdariffa]
MIYEVRVSEIGFSDYSANKVEAASKEKGKMSENPLPESKSESFSSSNINRSKSPTEVTGQHSQSGEDELNAAIIGNNRNFGKGGFDMGKGRSLGECELMGEKLEKMAVELPKSTDKNKEGDLIRINK